MNLQRKSLIILVLLCCTLKLPAQTNDGTVGTWYMYAFNMDLNNSLWGFQGDLQYRDWNFSSDIETISLRGGVHFTPKNTRMKVTLGYAHQITSPENTNNFSSHENRIYEEFRFTHILSGKFHLSHRFRFEQRFIHNEEDKTRFRYAIGMDIPLNHTLIIPKTWYLSVSDELFLHGKKTRDQNEEVGLFDRNRISIGLGYATSPSIKLIVGVMRQVSNFSKKTQFQFSVIQSF